MSEVAAWAKVNGGLAGVHRAIANGTLGNDPQSIRMALHYIEREELVLAQKRARDANLKVTEGAADTARKYALYAAISCAIAVASAIVAVLAVWWSR